MVEKSPGRSCRPDTLSSIDHKCQRSMKQGEVCRDKNQKCKGCAKKGEYIEVTVRCTQSPKSNNQSVRYTLLKRCTGMSVRDDWAGIGGDHVCWQI